MIKKETGKKREFSTGAKKQAASGKGTPVLVPGDAILEIAKHFEDGAEHYGARNWEKGIPLSELLNSLERHLQQLKMGLTDESHDRAMAWNVIVYLATKLRIEAGILPKELDDMPKYISAEELTEELGLDNKMMKKLLDEKPEEIKYCRDCIHHVPNGTACLEGIILSGEDQEVGTCPLFKENHHAK
ncbi:hypothetical protein LCGC14_1396840 [marine sediment metagenome]|uniref:dATP/dGTP diphosphohydrolase N-terminal domain-containing protein n=1 Tax=marine sediment metagenome TaxID=412755 RepID=A0A0F9MZW6_9ZZZZ|nr:hypothetical protein [Pricia sp.]